jgi:hypothetical protein
MEVIDWNVIDASNVHRQKHDLHRISTDEGMQIEFNDEHDENADSPI